MKTYELPPYAPVLMESTRAIGYSIEAAIADIIDNSIAASQQRYLDNRYISDPETMKDKCITLAKETIEKAQNNLLKIQQQERQPLIDNTIIELFLLKKALYVKYMANQKILQDRHSGNTKEQRVFAKSYIDEIPFISYYTLWNL